MSVFCCDGPDCKGVIVLQVSISVNLCRQLLSLCITRIQGGNSASSQHYQPRTPRHFPLSMTLSLSDFLGITGMTLIFIMTVSPFPDYRRALHELSARPHCFPDNKSASARRLPSLSTHIFGLGASVGFTFVGYVRSAPILALFSFPPIPFALFFIFSQLRLVPSLIHTSNGLLLFLVFTLCVFPAILLVCEFIVGDAALAAVLLSWTASAFSIGCQLAPLLALPRIVSQRSAAAIHRGFLTTGTASSVFLAVYYYATQINSAFACNLVATLLDIVQWALVIAFRPTAASTAAAAAAAAVDADLDATIDADAGADAALTLAVYPPSRDGIYPVDESSLTPFASPEHTEADSSHHEPEPEAGLLTADCHLPAPVQSRSGLGAPHANVPPAVIDDDFVPGAPTPVRLLPSYFFGTPLRTLNDTPKPRSRRRVD
jgi:hypothetical protein